MRAYLIAASLLFLTGCTEPDPSAMPKGTGPDQSFWWHESISNAAPTETMVPIQASTKVGAFSLLPGDKVTPTATFQLQAKVLGKACYNDNSTKYYACDLALGWGDMANPEFSKHVKISQSTRFWFYQYSYKDLNIASSVIGSQGSNMHIICASEEISKELSKIQKGDNIRLAGYLVNIENGNQRWRSSTTRTDSGNGACEIIYVFLLDRLE